MTGAAIAVEIDGSEVLLLLRERNTVTRVVRMSPWETQGIIIDLTVANGVAMKELVAGIRKEGVG